MLESCAATPRSCSAITSVRHTDLTLAPDAWRMRVLEALKVVRPFGQTTAFLEGLVERVRPHEGREGPRTRS
jgi:hypothetical protein